MGLHPEREGLDTGREQPGGVGGERRADIAQLLGAQAGEERVLAEVAMPVEPAVARHGLVEQGEVLIGPVEPTALDDDATEGGAGSSEELGGGVGDHVCAPLDRAIQVRGGDRRVDDQRQVVGVSDIR